jgi:hypothetical protein
VSSVEDVDRLDPEDGRAIEVVIVVGAANSSNSKRLCEVAEREGSAAQLIVDARDIDWAALQAITARASAPEASVKRILNALDARFETALETLTTATESAAFLLPRIVREAADALSASPNNDSCSQDDQRHAEPLA